MSEVYDDLFKFDMGDMFKDMKNDKSGMNFDTDFKFDMDFSMPEFDDFEDKFGKSFEMPGFENFDMPGMDLAKDSSFNFDFDFGDFENQLSIASSDFEAGFSRSLNKAMEEEKQSRKETKTKVYLARKEVKKEGRKRRREASRLCYDIDLSTPEGPEGFFYSLLGNINSRLERLEADNHRIEENKAREIRETVNLDAETVHYTEMARHRRMLSDEYIQKRFNLLEAERKSRINPNLFDRIAHSYYTWAVVWDQVSEEQHLKKLDRISEKNNAGLRY